MQSASIKQKTFCHYVVVQFVRAVYEAQQNYNQVEAIKEIGIFLLRYKEGSC